MVISNNSFYTVVDVFLNHIQEENDNQIYRVKLKTEKPKAPVYFVINNFSSKSNNMKM